MGQLLVIRDIYRWDISWFGHFGKKKVSERATKENECDWSLQGFFTNESFCLDPRRMTAVRLKCCQYRFKVVFASFLLCFVRGHNLQKRLFSTDTFLFTDSKSHFLWFSVILKMTVTSHCSRGTGFSQALFICTVGISCGRCYRDYKR